MRIGIVNDLAMAVAAIRQALGTSDRHQVAWVAVNGEEAVAMCAQDKPDLILMDLIMPVMSGVEATRQIMAKTPCPILVVTATVDGNSPKVFEALGAGALDAVNTPVIGLNASSAPSPLLQKIDMLGKLLRVALREKPAAAPPVPTRTTTSKSDRLVAIGSSAGGPVALANILSTLPADFPAAVVIIQHVDSRFSQGLADWLGHHAHMPVRLARDGDKLAAGTVLVAGTSDHLVFTNATTLGYTPHPRDYVYRPSVDVFFASVVQHWRGETTGVLLTGMGRDGAMGLKMLRDAGHYTIAQDRISSVVYGMPKEAAALDAAVDILPLDQIGPALKKSATSPKLKEGSVIP